MKKLSKQEWRCSGRFCLKKSGHCPKRETCLRYLALVKYDKENGIKDYRKIPVYQNRRKTPSFRWGI
jgi:hypothetical protein